MNRDDINNINNKEELADFIYKFREDLILHPEEWENKDLERFLSAMEAWIRVIDNYVQNTGEKDTKNPTWSTFAKILCAAKFYE